MKNIKTKNEGENMSSGERFDYIVEDAKSDDQVKTCREFVAFHSFNENGIYKQLRKIENQAMDLVIDGKIPSGVMFGTLNFKYEYKDLQSLLEQKNPHWRKTGSIVRMAEEALETAQKRLSELLTKNKEVA